MTDEFEEIKSIPTRVDLKKEYPISLRSIFERSFWALFAVVIIAIGYIYSMLDLDTLDNNVNEIENLANNSFYYIFKASCIVCALKLIYEAVNHYMYSYIIELEHLTITRGVLFRTRASFPIAKINDISLQRNLIQLLFGVYVVDILTASAETNFAEVHGLTAKNAIGLQSYLLSLVETTLPFVNNAAADEVKEGHTTSNQVIETLH